MPAPLTIYLIRHGEVHNPEAVHYGRLPNFFLSKTGREQAISAGKALASRNVANIYCSPMERTQETAKLIISQRENSLDVTIDERLIEVHTPHEGMPQAELEKINFDLYTGTQAPYEQPSDVRRRLIAFLNEMRGKHANQSIVAISHGDIVVSAFMFAMKQDENDMGRTQTQPNRIQSLGLPEMYPATASISTLTYKTDDPDEVPDYAYERPYLTRL